MLQEGCTDVSSNEQSPITPKLGTDSYQDTALHIHGRRPVIVYYLFPGFSDRTDKHASKAGVGGPRQPITSVPFLSLPPWGVLIVRRGKLLICARRHLMILSSVFESL
jgi:hypothetical protein